eukprot:scaffold5734_cov22-Tisochrysis_lutea.AAC.4
MCEHVGGGDSLEWERHLSIFAIILTLEVAHAGISICLLSDIKPRDTLHRNLEECLTPMQREAWLLRALCPYNGMLQSCMVVTGPHMHAANCRNCWWTNSVSWQCILSPQASQAETALELRLSMTTRSSAVALSIYFGFRQLPSLKNSYNCTS